MPPEGGFDPSPRESFPQAWPVDQLLCVISWSVLLPYGSHGFSNLSAACGMVVRCPIEPDRAGERSYEDRTEGVTLAR